jgi:hypothetical protein
VWRAISCETTSQKVLLHQVQNEELQARSKAKLNQLEKLIARLPGQKPLMRDLFA